MSTTTAPPKPPPLPFQWNLLAGAIAGVSEILTMYPLDLIKTRSQLSVTAAPSLFSTFGSIIKQEGFGGLYRGILPPILVEAPKRAIKFTANGLKMSVPNIHREIQGSLFGEWVDGWNRAECVDWC